VVAATDSLSCLLQILNHLQDLGKDWRELERLYLPAAWVAEAGALLPDLAGSRLTGEWREVVDRALNGCALLYARAEDLPQLLRAHGEPRLAAEAAMILKLARGLYRRLGREDPLAGRNAPSAGQKLVATGYGLGFLLRSFLSIQTPSRSNLALPILLLPRRQRQAVQGLYRFCRLLDDCADGVQPSEVKAARLAAWRVSVQGFCDSQVAGRPDDSLSSFPSLSSHPTEIKQLQQVIADYRLGWPDLDAIFAGMEFDLSPQNQLLSKAELELYCDRVATAVGRLYLTILGLDPGLALNLGRSLQRVNILRDRVEDGARGRCYLPRENFPSGFCSPLPFTVDEILLSPGFSIALQGFASDTASYFCSAARDLVTAKLSGRPRLSLELFARIYHRLFVKTLRAHQRTPERLSLTRVRLSWLDWFWILLGRA
ncbi:MAG: squalene/phytoene synthase family protein, partial [Alphaproteobacteria bacterium]|nr:squalene/phytoene synthase family protein [Alphaproteobacteria bacterium]